MTAFAIAFLVGAWVISTQIAQIPQNVSSRPVFADHFFTAWGIFVFAACVEILFLRYFWDAWCRKHTVYALSVDRIFIATRWRVRTWKRAKRPPTLERNNRRWFTVRFGNDMGNWPWGGRMLSMDLYGWAFAPRFDAVTDPGLTDVLDLQRPRVTPR